MQCLSKTSLKGFKKLKHSIFDKVYVGDAADVAITGTTSGVNSVYYQAGVCTIPVSLLCQTAVISYPTVSCHAHSCIEL